MDWLRRVSIPIGFSHQLRPHRPRTVRGDHEVSIPIGFSHQLRREGEPGRGGGHRFQSLSGFLIS